MASPKSLGRGQNDSRRPTSGSCRLVWRDKRLGSETSGRLDFGPGHRRVPLRSTRKAFWHLPVALTAVITSCLGAPSSAPAAGVAIPGSPKEPLRYVGFGLADPLAPDGGLQFSPGVQNVEIARANRKETGHTYQHHVDLGCWKGLLYAAWVMTRKDEDVLPCRLVYSTSGDGFAWSEPRDLYPPGRGWDMRFYFFHASNGRMLAFAASPTANDWPGYHMMATDVKGVLVREITSDHQLGEIYTLIPGEPQRAPSFERAGDTGFVAACREACNCRPLLEQQDYGSLLGARGMKWHDPKNWPGGKIGGEDAVWTFGKAFCFYHRRDGVLVGLCKLGFATLSTDEGESWSLPVVPPGIVAGSGKIWGQKTPDGRYALIYPPQGGALCRRYPMAVITGDDGITYRDMRVIHGEVPPRRYMGGGKKGDAGPQYLRGVAEWAGDAPTIDPSAIWAIYSVNKEDIWVSRIPVPIVPNVQQPVHDTFDAVELGPRVPGWNIYAPKWAPVCIAREKGGPNQFLKLEDRDPVDYARAVRVFPESSNVEVSFRLSAAQADRGRLEIDLLGARGTRPVRLALDDKGRIYASDGQDTVRLGTYQAARWESFTLQVMGGRFTVRRAGKTLLQDAAFAESTPWVYAISFRTGPYRARVAEPDQDLPNTEEPAPATVYFVDDVFAQTGGASWPPAGPPEKPIQSNP